MKTFDFEKAKGKPSSDCMSLVRRSPFIIRVTETQSQALCLEAVSVKPSCLKWVKNQTEKICLAAVKKRRIFFAMG